MKHQQMIGAHLALASALLISTALTACAEHECTLEARYTGVKVVDAQGNPAVPDEIRATDGKGRNLTVEDLDNEPSTFDIPESGGGTYTIIVEYCGREIKTTGVWHTDGEYHADGPDNLHVDVGEPCGA